MDNKKSGKGLKIGNKRIKFKKIKIEKDTNKKDNLGSKQFVYKSADGNKYKAPKQYPKGIKGIFERISDFFKGITLKKALIFAGISAFVIAVGGTLVIVYWMVTAPPLDMAKLDFVETTHLIDKNGNFYQELQGNEKRDPVTIYQIPKTVQLAFVSIEDKRFYQHNGVDLRGTTKAIFSMFTSGSLSGPGGSTITQQLIKLTHLTSDVAIKRKVQEWKLAIQLENKMSKEEILQAYLNKVNMSQAWGIQSGARYFFNKDADKLSISQSAVLASIINAPTYYNPLRYEEYAPDMYRLVKTKDASGKEVVGYDKNNKERALLVISEMYTLGHISESEYNQAKNEIENNLIALSPPKNNDMYSYFTDAVYNQAIKDIMDKYKYTQEEASSFLLNGGFIIKSTVDTKIQTIMENATAKNSIFPSQSSSAKAAEKAVSALKGEPVEYKPQVGMAIVENNTGYVVGLLGGRDKKGSLAMNRALRKFQPGSSTKPLTAYGPGIDSGAITAGTTFNDTQIKIGGWSPKNAGGGFRGMTTVRDGLRSSINTIAVQALMQTTAEVVLPYAEKLGLEVLETDMNPAAFALGGYTEGQSPLAMASAYTTFPNGGVRVEPILYTQIVDKNGKVIIDKKQEKIEVFKPGTAFIIADILKGVVRGGTTVMSIPGAPLAGKTGTTDKNMHAWFCGFTGDYAGAVWYGYDDNVIKVSGKTYNLNIGTYGGSSQGPAAFFRTVFTEIYTKTDIKGNAKPFPEKPSDVFSASVDGVSGKSPSPISAKDPRGSKIRSEYFIEGFGPNGVDDIHVERTICSISKMNATQYCPANVIQKKVLLDLAKIYYPPGVTDAKPNKSPGGQQALSAPAEDKICQVHTADSVTSIEVYNQGSPVSNLALSGGESQTINIKGVSSVGTVDINGGTSYSSQKGLVRITSSGSSATLTASTTANGNDVVTIKSNISSGGITYTLVRTINITVSGNAVSPPTPSPIQRLFR